MSCQSKGLNPDENAITRTNADFFQFVLNCCVELYFIITESMVSLILTVAPYEGEL